LKKYISIAIDGPAASGKSSVGFKLANRLGYLFLDTGIMYRAVTWAVLEKKISVVDEENVSKFVSSINITINPPTIKDGRVNDILINGLDITKMLIDHTVNENVSQISTYQVVRDYLTLQQRQISSQGDIVMVGRDIGSIVLPKATCKYFLQASVMERARRRFEEEKVKGGSLDFEKILKNVSLRDEIDSTRKIAPLVPAKDAIIINTDLKDLYVVVEEIYRSVQKCLTQNIN
jgi:cytidylate kinase